MKKVLSLSVVLFALLMTLGPAAVLRYDPASVTNNLAKVTYYSVGATVAGLNGLTDPVMPPGTLDGNGNLLVPLNFLKVDLATLEVSEISQADKDSFAAVIAGQLQSAVKAGAKLTFTNAVAESRILRAFALVMLDEINTLRTNASLPARTVNQLKNAILNKVDDSTSD